MRRPTVTAGALDWAAGHAAASAYSTPDEPIDSRLWPVDAQVSRMRPMRNFHRAQACGIQHVEQNHAGTTIRDRPVPVGGKAAQHRDKVDEAER